MGVEHAINRRLSTILFAAFVVAAISSLSRIPYSGQADRHPAQAPTTAIIVAAQDLPIGTLIKDGDLTSSSMDGRSAKGFDCLQRCGDQPSSRSRNYIRANRFSIAGWQRPVPEEAWQPRSVPACGRAR